MKGEVYGKKSAFFSLWKNYFCIFILNFFNNICLIGQCV
jgi:hypothetical protein